MLYTSFFYYILICFFPFLPSFLLPFFLISFFLSSFLSSFLLFFFSSYLDYFTGGQVSITGKFNRFLVDQSNVSECHH